TQHSMGCTHLDVATWQRERGVDPSTELELARASFGTSLKLDRRFELAHQSLGQTELVAARWAVDHGASPAARFEAARAALERALRADGNLEREIRPLLDEATKLAH